MTKMARDTFLNLKNSTIKHNFYWSPLTVTEGVWYVHTVAEKQQYFHSLLIYTQDFGINRTLSDRLEGMSAELLTPAHSATRAEVKENIYIHQDD